MEYNPDRWVIVKLTPKKKKSIYKVLAGWSGGYLDSDHYRISSGLKRVEEDGDYYLMYNHSGSVYKCHKKCNGFTGLMSANYRSMKHRVEKEGHKIETLSSKSNIIGEY